MPIWFDYREKALITLMPTIEQLTPPVGDIWIGTLSPEKNLLAGGIILERKTVADLEASIIDGRYKEQRARLLAYAAEHKVTIGYVIEGSIYDRTRILQPSALFKHMTRLLFHHRIPVLQTTSPDDTLRAVVLLEEQWKSDPQQFSWLTTHTPSETAVAQSYIKSECRDTPTSFLLGTLTQCRGISQSLAQLIQSKFSTLEEILKAPVEELAACADPGNPKRKVGLAVATRLHGLLHSIQVGPVETKKPKKITLPSKPTPKPRLVECLIQEEDAT